MKKISKFIGLVFVIALVLSLFTTAFAGYYQEQYAKAYNINS